MTLYSGWFLQFSCLVQVRRPESSEMEFTGVCFSRSLALNLWIVLTSVWKKYQNRTLFWKEIDRKKFGLSQDAGRSLIEEDRLDSLTSLEPAHHVGYALLLLLLFRVIRLVSFSSPIISHTYHFERYIMMTSAYTRSATRSLVALFIGGAKQACLFSFYFWGALILSRLYGCIVIGNVQ